MVSIVVVVIKYIVTNFSSLIQIEIILMICITLDFKSELVTTLKT